jgi:flagellar assembly protein FliH
LQQRVKKQAEQMLQQRLSQLTTPLQQATEQLHQEQQACIARWENQALELICAVVEKLIHRQVELDPALVGARLSELLQLTVGSSQIRIHLAQSDLDRIGPDLDEFLKTVQQRAQVEVIGTADFQPGDCFVQTEFGTLDARLSAQMERIVAEITGR